MLVGAFETPSINQLPLLLWDSSPVSLCPVHIQGIVRRMGMLECVAGSISIAGPGLRTAAQQGVSALDGLHRLLLPAADDSTPQGP